MSESPTREPNRPDLTRDLTRQEILAAARPLPPYEQSIIAELNDDEARRFLDAILDA